jgi:uncharacterized protein (DUF1786 family)
MLTLLQQQRHGGKSWNLSNRVIKKNKISEILRSKASKGKFVFGMSEVPDSN